MKGSPMNQVHTTHRMTLSIEGMSCGHCIQAVTNALAEAPSVRVMSVGVGEAEIEALSRSVADDAIAALGEAGYPARVAAQTPEAALTQPQSGCCGGPKCSCG
ncbi:MAG: hypothetical protein GC200_03505 [Tepidisphaera sp.]|nr:hypothetical protein [Tepidisphaera sp.]